MAGNRLNALLLLFRPEESPCLPEKKESPACLFRSTKGERRFSLKALAWTAISIAAGLAIGQL